MPETGTFLSRDPVESEPPYQYVRGNPVNLTDPSGLRPCGDACKIELANGPAANLNFAGHFAIVFTDESGKSKVIEAFPSEELNYADIGNPYYWNPILHPYSSRSGVLRANIRTISTESLEDTRKNNSDIDFVTISNSEEFCNKKACLLSAMKQVERNQIGYYIFGPNSNSAAISILRYCGLPWRHPIKIMEEKRGRTNPGKFLFLLGPEANSREANKELYEAMQVKQK